MHPFRRLRAWWTGACCWCERGWGSHTDNCKHEPDYLCKRCVWHIFMTEPV